MDQIRCVSCGCEFIPSGENHSAENSTACPHCKRKFPLPVARSETRIRGPRYPFVYQDLTNPAVAAFRQRHELDAIVADARDEFDALLAVRDWTFHRFPNGNPVHGHIDADKILEAARAGGTFHCTAYAFLSVQAYTALGYIARRLNIDVAEADPKAMPHMIYDVWSNTLNQWVVMDSKANVHFEIDGRPLSALQLRQAHLQGHDSKVDAVFGRGATQRILPKDREQLLAWARESERQRWNRKDASWIDQIGPMTDPRLYCFIGVYGAADFFSRPVSPNHARHYPVLIYYDQYNRDEHWWIRPKRQLEAYYAEGAAVRIEDPLQIEWPVNRTELQVSPHPSGAYEVNVWTVTPNFSHFEFRIDPAAAWSALSLSPDPSDGQAIPRWLWNPASSRRLEVRSVNSLGIGGVAASIQL